jgi:uncharacterized membrane protein YccC
LGPFERKVSERTTPWERLQLRPPDLRSDRRDEWLEAAAARSRLSTRKGAGRVRAQLWPVVQTAAAAGLAWVIADHLLGHPQPFFAPVAAIIALGATRGQRARRAIELMLGVALGIGLADLLIGATGTGVVQLAVVVGLAMAAALLLHAGQTLTTEAAVSAALVATVAPEAHGFPPTRLLDALIGGAVALSFSQVLFPVDPVRVVREAAEAVLDELGETLGDIAAALERRDLEAAEHAMLRAGRISDLWSSFERALETGREAARFAPRRRQVRDHFTTYDDAGLPLNLAVKDIHVLARGAVRALTIGDQVPPRIVEALRELAYAVRRIAGRLGQPERAEALCDLALRATTLATSAVRRNESISANVLAGYTQATAADVLRTLGFDREAAHEMVGRAAKEPHKMDSHLVKS